VQRFSESERSWALADAVQLFPKITDHEFGKFWGMFFSFAAKSKKNNSGFSTITCWMFQAKFGETNFFYFSSLSCC